MRGGWWRYGKLAPEEGAVFCRKGGGEGGARFGEAAEEDGGSGDGGVGDGLVEAGGVGGGSAVEDVREREAIEGVAGGGEEEGGGIGVMPGDGEEGIRRGDGDAGEEAVEIGVVAIGVAGEAAFEALAEDGAEVGGELGEERGAVEETENAGPEEGVEGEAEAGGIEMLAPVGELGGGVGEVEEGFKVGGGPAGEGGEAAEEGESAVGGAGALGAAGLGVGELGGVEVDGGDVAAVGGEGAGGAAGRGDGEDAGAGGEAAAFEGGVFPHVAEQELGRAGAVEATAAPGVHGAILQARARRTASWVSMATGSAMRWRAKRRPPAFMARRRAVWA
jgi:hypothetical protein